MTGDKSQLFNVLTDTKVSAHTIVLWINRRGFSVIAAVFCSSDPVGSDLCKRVLLGRERTMIDIEDRSGVHITMLAGERWKANMRRACIPAPYAATLILRSAWYAPLNRRAGPDRCQRARS